ncbi:TVA4 protein, partial [Chloroceryle aenea]|nr:TVA4 protein [Chloroceryle aenea]
RGQVQQEPAAETTAGTGTPEGTGIAISCSHPNIQTFEFINFYRQVPGRSPTFITFAHKGSKAVQSPAGRLSVSADRRSSSLWLSRPRRRDTAVYYCALG